MIRITEQEVAHLNAVEITAKERKAILAVLRSGLTGATLDALGLNWLMQRLEGSEVYDGPWQNRGLPKAPKMEHYGIESGQTIHTRKF